MTDDRLPLAELMAKTGDGDFLRTIAESVLQIIMEADVDGLVGASPELLVARRGPTVISRALAGSAPVTGDPQQDDQLAERLAHSAKDLEEHRYATRWMRNGDGKDAILLNGLPRILG